MTKLLMCSGVSSIIQQLAELMSQAWGQRQAQARGQPGWPGRQKSGTVRRLCWAGAAGAGRAHGWVPTLRFRSGGLMWNSYQRKRRTSGWQDTGQDQEKKRDAGHVQIRKTPSGDLMGIKSFGEVAQRDPKPSY